MISNENITPKGVTLNKMELEFDKEIDALLRKARSDTMPVGNGLSSHLDADERSAFAENAMPEKTKQLYFAHLADCDACRKTLSNLINLNSEAAPEAAFAATAAAATINNEAWYRRLFAMPNLAYGMGALVLLFSGFLGYIVLQNGSRNAEVSQVSEKESRASGPSVSSEPQSYANSAANTMANAANAAVNANAVSTSPNPSVTKSGVTVGSANSAPDTDRNEVTTTDTVAGQPAAEAPAPQPKNLPLNGRNLKDLELDKAKEETKTLARDEKMRSDDQRAMRETPMKKAQATPGGPRVNMQNNTQDSMLKQNAAGTVSNVRTSGGKNFEYKEGVWYDSAYRGQSTKTFRRGTSEYIRLDGGLRSIADSIGGTVVLVWKEKAYRIQ